MPRSRYTGPPINVRQHAPQWRALVRGSLCRVCGHEAVLAVDEWPDHMPVPSFGPCMVCTGRGTTGADARPNWEERPTRPFPDRTTVALMAKPPTAEMIAEGLSVPERIMLFCVASAST